MASSGPKSTTLAEPDLAAARLLAWHREGKLAGGAALPGGLGGGVVRTPRLQLPSPPPPQPEDQTEGRGRGPAQAPALPGDSGQLLGRRITQPAHSRRSGPRPGAFRAQAAARSGKSRPPSRRRSTAGQSWGRGFPESARRPPARHCAESDHVWAKLPPRQRGKPRRGCGGSRACALSVCGGAS